MMTLNTISKIDYYHFIAHFFRKLIIQACTEFFFLSDAIKNLN